jgi:hypothetical protein
MQEDYFQNTIEKFIEILRDPDYKPHLIEALKAHIEHERAETRDLESQTLARLDRIHRPRKTQTQ